MRKSFLIEVCVRLYSYWNYPNVLNKMHTKVWKQHSLIYLWNRRLMIALAGGGLFGEI